MTLPFTLPDWVPWWVNLVILLPALLFALAFLFMPFSVIGVKARLEGIEARLDEIQGEIRTLTLRLPEGAVGGIARTSPTVYVDEEAPLVRPPIPPAAAAPAAMRDPRATAPSQRRADRMAPTPRERTEPRLG